MDPKCSFLEAPFPASILSMPKHLLPTFHASLLTEKAKVFNMEKNNKKWVGQFSLQL